MITAILPVNEGSGIPFVPPWLTGKPEGNTNPGIVPPIFRTLPMPDGWAEGEQPQGDAYEVKG